MKFSTASAAIITATAFISNVAAAPLPPQPQPQPQPERGTEELKWPSLSLPPAESAPAQKNNWPFITSLDPASHHWDAELSKEPIVVSDVNKRAERRFDAICMVQPKLEGCPTPDDNNPLGILLDLFPRQVGQGPPADGGLSNSDMNPFPFHHKKDVIALEDIFGDAGLALKGN